MQYAPVGGITASRIPHARPELDARWRLAHGLRADRMEVGNSAEGSDSPKGGAPQLLIEDLCDISRKTGLPFERIGSPSPVPGEKPKASNHP